MVLPLRDDDTDRHTTPVVTYALIGVNVVVWLIELSIGEPFINGYSTVPAEITQGRDLVGTQTVDVGGQSIPIQLYPGPTPIQLTLLSSMFMHASWAHILGNMLYLWIFGDNVEDRIGHAKFLVFYLVCGLAASAAHIMFGPDSVIPSLGASGAIAGVLGAYLVLFPRRSVRVLMASGLHGAHWRLRRRPGAHSPVREARPGVRPTAAISTPTRSRVKTSRRAMSAARSCELLAHSPPLTAPRPAL
jgi:membrane associated rhomboid family serine protease